MPVKLEKGGGFLYKNVFNSLPMILLAPQRKFINTGSIATLSGLNPVKNAALKVEASKSFKKPKPETILSQPNAAKRQLANSLFTYSQ